MIRTIVMVILAVGIVIALNRISNDIEDGFDADLAIEGDRVTEPVGGLAFALPAGFSLENKRIGSTERPQWRMRNGGDMDCTLELNTIPHDRTIERERAVYIERGFNTAMTSLKDHVTLAFSGKWDDTMVNGAQIETDSGRYELLCYSTPELEEASRAAVKSIIDGMALPDATRDVEPVKVTAHPARFSQHEAAMSFALPVSYATGKARGVPNRHLWVFERPMPGDRRILCRLRVIYSAPRFADALAAMTEAGFQLAETDMKGFPAAGYSGVAYGSISQGLTFDVEGRRHDLGCLSAQEDVEAAQADIQGMIESIELPANIQAQPQP